MNDHDIHHSPLQQLNCIVSSLRQPATTQSSVERDVPRVNALDFFYCCRNSFQVFHR